MFDGLTWTGQYTLFQDLMSDDDAANLIVGQGLIKQGQKRLEAILGIRFTEESTTFTTVTDAISGTSNQDYKLPRRYKKFRALYVTVGTTEYPVELIQDEEFWREINSTTTQQTSDFAELAFVRRDRVSLYPIPSSANTATFIYEASSNPHTTADYTDGSISDLANGATTITGSSTTFTSAMAGRYFRITSDGGWYKLASFTTTTAMELDSNYEGLTISGGSEAYTIGQMPITPPETHELPVYYACWKYSLFRKDVQLAREFERQWKEGIRDAQADHANQNASSVVSGLPLRHGRRLVNPNYYPQNMS